MSVCSNTCYTASGPMATSSSSAADDTPDSVSSDHVSVLDYAQRYAGGPRPQSECPRSSKRKRQRDGPSLVVEEQTNQSASLHRVHHAAGSRADLPSHTVKATRTASAPACQNTNSYYTAIFTCLMQWCCRLKALQPKCIITKEVVHRSLDLFHRYRQSCQADQANSSSEGRVHLTATHLAACLWLASKSDGNRACVPSRTLLTKAVTVCPEELSKAEVTICCKLNWNIFNSQVASALQH